MEKMTGYEINHLEGKTILSKRFAKAAGILDTPEYKTMKQLREENPGYTFELREIKKRVGKKSYKKLTYLRMRDYITVRGDVEMVNALEQVIKLSEIKPGSYAFVKTWFLSMYPNYQEVDGEEQENNILPMVRI